MGKCVERLPHSCGTRKGLQVFLEDDGKYTGYCFHCGEHIADPYGSGKPPKTIKLKTRGEIEEEISEIRDEWNSQDTRGIPLNILDYFGIKIGVSEFDGVTPRLAAFPYTKDLEDSGYKLTTLDKPKKMWSVGDLRSVDLFGWKQAIRTGARKLFITEGEWDAAALCYILMEYQRGGKYEGRYPAVVSIPHGAGSARKDLVEFLPQIRKYFKEVVLVFDNDEAGKAAVEDVCKVAVDFQTIELPMKDANECLNGGYKKLVAEQALFRSNVPKNSRLVDAETLHEAAKEPAQWGVSWPWPGVNELTRGIRKGETIYIGAAQKMGKSEVVNALGAHLIKEHGWSVLMAKPEEANKKTYKLMCGKLVGKVFHDPKIEFDYDAYDRAGEMIKGKLKLLNIYQHLGWETLKLDITYAAAQGIDAVFIDPITNLTNGMDAAAANTKLQEIAQELAAMALDLNIVIFIFCHLRNPDSGPSHDRGGEVLTSQFAGSRAMGRSCNYMFGIEGNKDPDLPPEQRNLRQIVLLDDREFGEVGRTTLYWDKQTGLFREVR